MSEINEKSKLETPVVSINSNETTSTSSSDVGKFNDPMAQASYQAYLNNGGSADGSVAPNHVEATSTSVAPNHVEATSTSVAKNMSYTIQKGDNLWNIAKKTGLSYDYLLEQYTQKYNGGVQQSDLSNHMIYVGQTIDLQINTEEIMKGVNSINSIIGQLSSLNTAVCGHISDLWNLEAFQILNLKKIFVEYIENTSKSSNTVVSDLGSIINWLDRVVQNSNVDNVSISAVKYTADFTNTSLIIDTKYMDSDTAYSVVFDIDKAQSGISKIKALQSDYDSLKQDWENVKTNLRSYGWAGNNSNAFYVHADEITSELRLLSDNIEKLYSQINAAIDSYENTINSLKF